MSYYTDYSISYEGDIEDIHSFEKDVEATVAGVRDVHELIHDGSVYSKFDFIPLISTIAKNYPDLLVILEGTGEESSDQWEHRWRGTVDEMHYLRIPPFTNPVLMKGSEKEKSNI